MSFVRSAFLSLFLSSFLSVSVSFFRSFAFSCFRSFCLSFFLDLFLSFFRYFFLSFCVSFFLSVCLSLFISFSLSLFVSSFLSRLSFFLSVALLSGVSHKHQTKSQKNPPPSGPWGPCLGFSGLGFRVSEFRVYGWGFRGLRAEPRSGCTGVRRGPRTLAWQGPMSGLATALGLLGGSGFLFNPVVTVLITQFVT